MDVLASVCVYVCDILFEDIIFEQYLSSFPYSVCLTLNTLTKV